MKKSLLVILSALLMFALAACGGGQKAETPKADTGGKEPAASGETIKIGGIFSSSGGAAPLGAPEAETVKMLTDQINEAGGIDGKKIELISYDDKSDQNEAVLSTKKLIEQDKVTAIIGGTTSGNSLAMIPNVMKSQMPYISLAASKEVHLPTDKSPRDWVFKTAQGDDVVIPKVVEYLKEQNLSKIAWLNVANPYGTGAHNEFLIHAKDAGIEIVAEEEFEATVNDAKAMLTRVKGKKPEAVIVWGTVQETAVVVKNIRELKIDIPVLASHGIGNTQFIELAGDAANGVIFPAPKLLVADALDDADPQKKVLLDYKKAYEDKYNKPASTFGGHAWDAFMILVEAIKQGGTDQAAIRDALEGTKGFVGISGQFNMSPENHNGLDKDSLAVIKIENGAWTINK